MSIFYVILVGIIAYWVYQDGQQRGMSSLWAVGTLFMPFVFLLLYFIFRKPVVTRIQQEEDISRVCYQCGKQLEEGDRYCSRCGVDTQNPKRTSE